MNIVLFDTPQRKKLHPLTLTRAVCEIRMGIFTIKERWQRLTNHEVFILTTSILQPLYKEVATGDCLLIDACVLPSEVLLNELLKLPEGYCITDGNYFIGGRISINSALAYNVNWPHLFSNSINFSGAKRLQYPHEIFLLNDEFIRFDFSIITKAKVSSISLPSVQLQNASQIFIEDNASISANVVLNASAGPIYIGKNVTVMEGCLLRGPIAICDNAVIKMGAKIYGATTIGPRCVVGGEIKNSVFFANSNKAHDGYIGDSVIGEWCNMGAGTSNSNVKNTGGQVKQWNYYEETCISTGNKCGVIMGDHSKTAINTSINTGSVIGVCCNVFGDAPTPKFIPDFSWGADGKTRYQFIKAFVDIANWKKMKNQILSDVEANVLKHIFDNS